VIVYFAMSVALGLGVPPHTPHAISVSLPTWRDNIGYEEGEERVVNAMVSGYPRFFIHLSIRKLAAVCEHKYAVANEQCMLFPARFAAEECRDFVRRRAQPRNVQPRLVHLFIYPDGVKPTPSNTVDLHIVLVPADVFGLAKEFWQHTGLGISSRLAEKCLSLLPDESSKSSSPPRPAARSHNRHYSVKGVTPSPTMTYDAPKDLPTTAVPADLLSSDHTTYLEERYGRNLPLSAAESAKRALRRRIARTLIRDNFADGDCGDEPCAGQENKNLTGPSSRGVPNVTEDDVYLYPSGMAAIWSAHKLLRDTRPEGKSVCFGFVTYSSHLPFFEVRC
jgi:cystathionine gamma-synthase